MHIATLIILVTCIALLLTILKIFSSKVMFNPTRVHIYSPTRHHVDTIYQGVHMWHFNDYPGRPVILYCHGMAGNISFYSVIITLTKRLEINLILFDCHGYGKTPGQPSPNMWIEDAEIAYSYALNHYSANDIVILGESLGGTAAIHLAKNFACRCLILLATFASLDSLARQSNRYALNLVGYVLSIFESNFPNIENIKDVTRPLLIMHSNEDGFIPISHAYQLLTAYRGASKKLIITSGTHTQPQFSRENIQDILNHIGVVSNADYTDILRQLRLYNDKN